MELAAGSVHDGPDLPGESRAVVADLFVRPPVAGVKREVVRVALGWRAGGRRAQERESSEGVASHDAQWIFRLPPLPCTITSSVAERGPTARVSVAGPESPPRSRPTIDSFTVAPFFPLI